jgi:hypothetical protein
MVKIILALVIVASVISQTPRRGEIRQPQQTQSSSAKHPTAPNQQGTEESPIFIKEIPTPKTQQDATQEAKDRADKSANEKNWLSSPNGW